MLYKQVSRKQEISLDLCMPNEGTKLSIDEARKDKGVIPCKDADDLFTQLGI
jgi:antitoxin component of RelBE/YafQ-DinJ toxin-antitoxin module